MLQVITDNDIAWRRWPTSAMQSLYKDTGWNTTIHTMTRNEVTSRRDDARPRERPWRRSSTREVGRSRMPGERAHDVLTGDCSVGMTQLQIPQCSYPYGRRTKARYGIVSMLHSIDSSACAVGTR